MGEQNFHLTQKEIRIVSTDERYAESSPCTKCTREHRDKIKYINDRITKMGHILKYK